MSIDNKLTDILDKWDRQLSVISDRIISSRKYRVDNPVMDTAIYQKYSSIKEDLKSAYGEKEGLKKMLSASLMEKQKLETYADSQAKEIAALRIQLGIHAEEYDYYKARSRVYGENIAILIKNLGDQLSLAEKGRRDAQKEAINGKNAYEELKKEAAFLHADVEKRSRQVDGLLERNNELEKTVKERESEINILYTRLKHLEEERKQLIDEIRKIKLNAILKHEKRKEKKPVLIKIFGWLGKPLVNVEIGK